MKKKNKIDWKSKLIDLLIVIIGITIAFQLNNLNESNKSKVKENNYIKSFFEENRDNESSLVLALEFTVNAKNDIDTLKSLLLTENYHDARIRSLSGSMMAISDFKPSLITMENITASGDFELISNFEYREKLIETYNSYETTSQFETILSDYVNQYVSPFFFENVKFRDFTSIEGNFSKKAEFENIVLGYDALIIQKLKGYELCLEKLRALNKQLSTASIVDK